VTFAMIEPREGVTLAAPFPWFGGKRKVAPQVWAALGDVGNYCEPFAGSLAVLLGRPTTPRTETVNDIDAFLANFWRALQHEPDAVAKYADWPVNETDLTARHIWLVQHRDERLARLHGNPDYYDAQVAGWWVWGLCQWIGSGWCSGNGPWSSEDGQLVHLGNPGQGVNRQLVHLGNPGQGVNRQREHLGGASGAMPGVLRKKQDLYAYMRALSARLRKVRVCCGDWQRVVTDGALSYGNTVGVFLDPPYDTDVRGHDIYNSDDEHGHVSAAVREWCLENGDNPHYRIVLAGYEGEHVMPDTWRVYAYKGNAAYQNADANGANQENRHKERLWFSLHCLRPGSQSQTPLPGVDGGAVMR